MEYDPNWRQKALDIGDDQNSAKYASMRAAEASMNSGGGGGAGANVSGMFQQPTMDLQGIYQKLYDTSGIKDTQAQYDTLQGQLTERQKARDSVLAKINDNPFYSEGTRVGRAAKVNEQYNNEAVTFTNQQKLAQDKIATQKADIETRVNIATKQFDINSQQAKQAFDQFTTLLESGALDNASGEDIANITRATGVSSAMIQSAVNAQKQKNVKTSIQSYDDGTNQGYAVIDSNTGKIINQQVIAASKPEKATGGAETKKETAQNEAQYLIQLYKNTNKSNPSWAKGHDLRNKYSPKDFKNMLLVQYPSQADYIKSIKF